MIKREVARGLASGAISSNPQEGMSKEQFLASLDMQYPCADGWEIVNANMAGMAGNSIGVIVFLAKYVYEAEPVKLAKKQSVE